jgi:hypothetical protein
MASLAQIDKFAVGKPLIYTQFLAARLQCAWDILANATASADEKAWARKIATSYDSGDVDMEYRWFLSDPTVQVGSPADAVIVAAVKRFIPAWAAPPPVMGTLAATGATGDYREMVKGKY